MTERALQSSLDAFDHPDPPSRSQSPVFVRVARGLVSKYPRETEALAQAAYRLGCENGRPRIEPVTIEAPDGTSVHDSVVVGGFTAEQVLERAGGRDLYPKNLIGAVLGSLRRRHYICTDPRFRCKAKHLAAKGRWQNVFWLNPDRMSEWALRDAIDSLENDALEVGS